MYSVQNIFFPLYLNKHLLYKDLNITLLVCYILFCSLSFIPLLIIKNGLSKNKIRGPLYARGWGGQGWSGPRTISIYFFIFEPFPKAFESFIWDYYTVCRFPASSFNSFIMSVLLGCLRATGPEWLNIILDNVAGLM